MFKRSLFYKLKKNFFAVSEQINRMYCWAFRSRYSYDFDGHTMYDMIYYKLDRMYRCFLNYGNCVWNDGENTVGMKKLRIARQLAWRLAHHDYEEYRDKILDLKYGKSEMDFVASKYGSRVLFKRNGIDVRSIESYSKDLLRLANMSALQRKNEKELLFKLLAKHLDSWWD